MQDHSNNDLKNKDFSATTKTSTPLKIRLFISLHMVHVKHKGAKSQAKEVLYLPNQILYVKSSSITLFDITYKKKNTLRHHPMNPKHRKYKSTTLSQLCSAIKIYPILIRLSPIRTFPHVAVHTKNATLFEALAFLCQILF